MEMLLTGAKIIKNGESIEARDGTNSVLEMWNPDDADCWWAELAIGDKAPSIFARILPWSLPYVGWQRGVRNDLRPRFFPFNKALAIYEFFNESSGSSSCPRPC